MILLIIMDGRAPDAQMKVLWLMFRQHSWEAGSSWAGEGALRFLLSADPVAVQIRRTAIFKIFPLCDPDGVARGGGRFNVNGLVSKFVLALRPKAGVALVGSAS